MFLHRSTPSAAEAVGPVPAAFRISRVESVRYSHQCLHVAELDSQLLWLMESTIATTL
jgi:hypothetical protein